MLTWFKVFVLFYTILVFILLIVDLWILHLIRTGRTISTSTASWLVVLHYIFMFITLILFCCTIWTLFNKNDKYTCPSTVLVDEKEPIVPALAPPPPAPVAACGCN